MVKGRLQEISTKQFIADLDILLSEQINCADTLILTGDFNYHYEKTEKSDVISLADLTSSYGLSQIVSGPTHKLGHTLDLLFVNKHEFDLQVRQPESYNLGDHYPLFFEIPNIYNFNKTEPKKVTFRNIKSVDRKEFSTSLCNSLDEKYISSNMNNLEFSEHVKMFSNCAHDS